MSSRFYKAFRAIFFHGQFHRFWQIVNKSPLVHIMASLNTALAPQIEIARRREIKDLQLTVAQTSILAALQKEGFALVNNLFSAEDFSNLEEYLSEKIALAEVAKKNQKVQTKDFWIRLSDSDLTELKTSHPMVEISLKPSLLEVVSQYLGQAPFLQYVLLTHSIPSGALLKGSQLWHTDHDSHRMLKFFIYLTEVEKDESGPFTLLPATQSQKVKNSFFPKHLQDADVSKYADLSQVVKIKGHRLTAFLCDTGRCYHMGSRVAPGHERIMTTTLFEALPSPYPGATKREIRIDTNLSSLQRRAIEA